MASDSTRRFRSISYCAGLPRIVSAFLFRKIAGLKSAYDRRLLCCSASAVLVMLCSGISWATYGLTFQGVTRTINMGGAISLSSPSAVVVDPSGNLYIADTVNNQIVKVDPQGNASALSISGLSPGLSYPQGIAIDGSGNLYVADSANNRAVEIDTAGNGSVISMGGITLNSPEGIAVDNSGNIFIADTNTSRIIEVPAGGAAAVLNITGTAINTPIGLAVDTSGNLYIADSLHNRVITVASKTTAGTALTISGGVTLSAPSGVAVDAIGNVYIADTGDNRIVMVDKSGNGAILFTNSATLSSPLGVAVDVFGSVYVADTEDNRCLLVNPPVNANVTAGDATYSLNKSVVGFGHVQLGSSSPITLTLPFTIAASPTLGSVSVFTQGTPGLDFTAGSGTTCVSGMTSTSCSVDVQFLPTAPGLRTGAVVLYDNAAPANPILTIPLYGFADSPVAALSPNSATVINTGGVATNYPFQLALDGAGNLYVANYVQTTGSPKAVKILAGGAASAINTSPVTLGTSVTGIAVDGAGNVFIADYYNNRIVVVTPGGIASVLAITGLSPALGQPTELAFDGAGNLYIADYAASGRAYSRAVEISSLVVAGATSSGLGRVIGTGSYSFSSSSMTGLAVAPNGTVYIAARTSNTSHVVQVTAAGAASLLNPTGFTFSNPQGAFVDGMGNLYVEDAGNSRIVRVTSTGVASALSISGLTSPSTLAAGYGVATDALGNFYIPDWNNNRIVLVNVSGALLNFASTKQGLTSTDSPKTATVTNLGNQALVFAADPAYTADFSQSSSGTNQCFNATSLSSGAACNVSVQFTPQSVGSLSAGIIVTDNTLNVSSSTQQVSVSGTGINPGDTTASAVSTNPVAGVDIGQPLTVSATVTDTTVGHTSTIPTGSVSFTDTVGSTVVSLNSGTPVALSGGIATLTGVTLSGAGTHTIAANYLGVSGTFLASSNTTTISVTKAAVTVTGPASQPVAVTNGQAGSVAITVTGPYSGVAVPTGSLTYTVADAGSNTVASGTLSLTAGSSDSTASVPVSASLASGTYSVSVTYGGDSNYAAISTPTTIQVSVGQITPTISWTQPGAITYGTQLASLLTASALNGTTAVPGSFSYTATPSGGSAGAVLGTTVLGAGTYTLTGTFAPADTATYAAASGSVTLTVAKATPTIALTSSADTVLVTNSVTFTSTVSSTISTPTGSVNFYDGTTLLGTASLSQGVATYAISSLAIGSHTVTAAYAGNSNFSSLTSSAITEKVDDFTLNISSGTSSSNTAVPGGTAVYSLAVGPSTGTTFPVPVTLSVSGVPPGASATITPQVIPAGSALTNITLSVQLPAAVASQRHSSGLLALKIFMVLPGMILPAILWLPFRRKSRRQTRRIQNRILGVLLLALLGTSLAGLTGCAKNSGFFGHQQQTYTLTFTATSGSLSHSTNLSLTVE